MGIMNCLREGLRPAASGESRAGDRRTGEREEKAAGDISELPKRGGGRRMAEETPDSAGG